MLLFHQILEIIHCDFEFYLENKETIWKFKKVKKIQALLKDINNYGGVSLLSLMEKRGSKGVGVRINLKIKQKELNGFN